MVTHFIIAYTLSFLLLLCHHHHTLGMLKYHTGMLPWKTSDQTQWLHYSLTEYILICPYFFFFAYTLFFKPRIFSFQNICPLATYIHISSHRKHASLLRSLHCLSSGLRCLFEFWKTLWCSLKCIIICYLNILSLSKPLLPNSHFILRLKINNLLKFTQP